MQPSDLGNKARSIQASQLPMVLAAGVGVSIVLHVGAIVGISQWWQPPAAPPDAPIEVTLLAPEPVTLTPTRSIPPKRPQPQQNVAKRSIAPSPTPIKLPATPKLRPFLHRTQPPTQPTTRSNIKPVISKVEPKPVKPVLTPKSIVRAQPFVPPVIAPTPPPFDLPIPTKPKSSPQLARSRRANPIALPSPQTISTPLPQSNSTPVAKKPPIDPAGVDRPVFPTPLPADKGVNMPQTPKPASPRTVRESPSVAPTEVPTPRLDSIPSIPAPSSVSTSRSLGTSQNPSGSGRTLTDNNRATGNERRSSPSSTGGTGNSGSNPTGNSAITGNERRSSPFPSGGTGNGGNGGNGGNSANSPAGNTTSASTGNGAGKLECLRNCEIPKLRDLQDTDGGKDRLRIRIAIDANGMVTDAQIAKSSGNPQIDTAALEGIKQMQFVPSGRQINGIIRANILIRSARPLLVPAIAYSYESTQTC